MLSDLVTKHATLIVACVNHVTNQDETIYLMLSRARRLSWMKLTQIERHNAKQLANEMIRILGKEIA